MKKALNSVLFVVCVLAAAAVIYAIFTLLPLGLQPKMVISGAIIVIGVIFGFIDAKKRRREAAETAESEANPCADTTFARFKALDIDKSLLSLEQAEEVYPHFCYPTNAEPIGFEGSIMYCFIDGYGETVFAANPETCADTYVYPLASSFADFIGLILTCGSANPVEQIVWMRKEQVEKHMEEERANRTEAQNEALLRLKTMDIPPIEDPFEYVKALQKDFDYSRIVYSDEYYDVLGIER